MAFEEIRSGNVENIMLWRESLSVMPDSHFFDLLRMYLGEIKTPYNKQNLIENLSGFLRKEENKQTIISLLSKEDLYGYQICQLMEEKSGGRFTMLEGSLYLILYKLVELEYLTTYTKLVGKRRTRKYYHLEESGRKYLSEMINEYDEISKGIHLILDREEK